MTTEATATPAVTRFNSPRWRTGGFTVRLASHPTEPGRFLAAGVGAHTAWDVEGEGGPLPEAVTAESRHLNGAVFTPDGALAVLCYFHEVRVLRWPSGELVARLDEGGNVAVDVSDEHIFVAAGKTVTLHDRTGGSTDDLYESFSLTEFDGLDAAGPWTLVVSDHAYADKGVLEGWDLEITLK